MGENIDMLPSDMNLKIKTGTVGYKILNKILISNGKFSLGKNEKVNASFAKPEEETTKKLTKIHKVVTQKPIITHEEERAALILFLTGGFTIWFMFQ